MAKHEYPKPAAPAKCLNCSGTEFGEEAARLPSKWGASSHLLTLYICTACGFTMTFYTKKSLVTVD